MVEPSSIAEIAGKDHKLTKYAMIVHIVFSTLGLTVLKGVI